MLGLQVPAGVEEEEEVEGVGPFDQIYGAVAAPLSILETFRLICLINRPG